MQETRIGIRQLLATMLVLAAAQGCQGQRATVNRVQPDYINKSDLIPNQYQALTIAGQTPETLTPQLIAKEPVFYTQTTLIAKPTTTGFTGLTSYGQSDKIRWQVTENSLIARQAYEYVKNAPGGGAGIGQQVQTGDVVAVFKINSHFDIRREYNTTTGEELNVIVENSTDRPWYQRQYMHVDWSQNLVTGYNSIFLEQEWSNQLQAEPIPVFVNTPNDPNAPVFAYSGPDNAKQLDYFDVVNQAVLHPETASLSYSEHPGSTTTFSSIPVCNLGEGETDCAPAQVTMRLAFKRVDPNRDYEPASLTEALPDADGSIKTIPHLNMERFGFFDVMRIGWDPASKAVLDTQRMHLAARHNLWLHHHAIATGDLSSTGCNFDADCAPAAGTQTQVCKIDDTPYDGAHRGVCAALAYAHLDSDIMCKTDDDCRQYSDTSGVSRTATCDPGTNTCGEHFYRCTKDADCATVDKLSTCDMASGYLRADNHGLCLMPFAHREVRPIAYHESNNYPDYMQPVTEQIVKEWNTAFVEAVTSARRHECEIRRGIDPTGITASANPCNDPKITGLDPSVGGDAQFIYVGCHSPVWGTDDKTPGTHSQIDVDAAHARGWDLPACGPQGTSARIGDLRYNMIGAITDQDAQGYWGLANIAADPETGEMVAGRGAVWQTITDYYATQLVTYVQLLNNDILPTAVTNGGTLVSSMKALGAGASPSHAILDLPIINQGLKATTGVMNGIAQLKLPDAGWYKPGTPLLSNDPENPGALARAQQRLANGRMLGDGTDLGTQRLLGLAGTPLEGRLMNSNQARLAASAKPDDTVSLPSTLEVASPLRGQSTSMRHMLNRIRANVSAFQCGMEAGFNDDLLLGLAQRLSAGAPIMQNNPDDATVAFGRDWNFKKGGGLDYDLMRQYAAQFIHHGVLAHELGHSLGQRHNFTASADAINYHDNYWVYRGQGHKNGIRPRYEYLADPADGKYYSQEEIDGRVDEWSYSSVMDYKGLNEDAHGIGRYDHAFIKNGYVNLVEAFKDVQDVDGALTYAENTAGNGFSSMLDLRTYDGSSGLKGMHYSQIPAIFGTKADGTPNIGTDNRYDVFLNETESQDVPGFGTPSFTNVVNDGHVLVPYRFDSDERAGLVWQDQRYDAGPDAYESLHYVASHLIDYYFINSYARLRSGFSTSKYVERIWSRYMEQFRQTTQIMAFDLANYQDIFGAGPAFTSYANDPTVFGGYINQTAMSMTADTMVSILTMPELGTHAVSAQFDGSGLYTPNQASFGVMLDIPVNDGRAFESSWRNDVGFFWYDMLDRAGAYYDKVMMLQALTDPELLLLQRDTPTDIRKFQLSFYTMFPDQMLRLFGGLLSEDFADYAPVVHTSDLSIQRTHVATLNGATRVAQGRTIDGANVPLDPQDHFTIQLWSAVQSIAQFPATYDQRYMDHTRLWIDGGIEAIDVPAANTVAFADPFSHQTYRALHFGCGGGGDTTGATVGCSPTFGGDEAGIAARMILHLKAIDTARLAATGDAKLALETQEKQYLDLINVMRNLTQTFGHGYAQTP